MFSKFDCLEEEKIENRFKNDLSNILVLQGKSQTLLIGGKNIYSRSENPKFDKLVNF